MKRKLLALLLLLALLSGCAGRAKPDKQTSQGTSTATQTAVTESVPTTTEVTPTPTEPTEVATTEPVTTVPETTLPLIHAYTPSPLVPLEEPDTGTDQSVMLYVSTNYPFSIKNAEGQWRKEGGGKGAPFGNMEIYRDSFFVTDPVTFTYELPYSISYTIRFDNMDNNSITIAWDENSEYYLIVGQNISEIFISPWYVTVVGDHMSYSCRRSTSVETYTMCFYGEEESNFTFYRADDGYTIITEADVHAYIYDAYEDDMTKSIIWSTDYPAGTNQMPPAKELIAAANSSQE